MIYSDQDEEYGYDDFCYTGVNIITRENGEVDLAWHSFLGEETDRYYAIPMMCKGVRDINKKLIYDNDIVIGRCETTDNCDTKITHGMVHWEEYGDCIHQDGGFMCELCEGKNLKIIGNMFENQELIQKLIDVK